MVVLSAREKRRKIMAEKGYYSLSPEKRATRLQEGFDSLRALASSLSEAGRDRLEKGAPAGSNEH